MKKFLLPIFFVSLVHSTLFSQVLYSSTAYTSRFNPGFSSQGTPIVAYDDVSISANDVDGSTGINVTKINVGVRRAPNAPATNINLYYTAFTQDSVGGACRKSAPIFLGKVSLPANGNALVTSIISFGDSVSTLFKINPDVNVATSGVQKFLIGASFDNPSPANGIILTKEQNNADALWIDNGESNESLYATNFSGRLPAAYYLQVFGKASAGREEKNQYSDVAVKANVDLNTVK